MTRNKGLPIGNLTSQFFANVYLDRLDHYLKEELNCKHYIRYMDDMVVFDDSKAHLREVRAAMIEALERLRLKVHRSRAQVWPVTQGTDWLGYRIYPTHRLVRRSNVRKFHRKLRSFSKAYRQWEIGLDDVKPSVMSWLGHIKHADSYGLRKKIFGEISFQRG